MKIVKKYSFIKYLKSLALCLSLVSLSMSLTGCKKEEDAATTTKQFYYDPRVPFGNINLNTTTIQNVKDLVADATVIEKIKLTWKVPPIYTTLNYKVVIFKRKEPPEGFNIVCPKPAAADLSLCPADEYSAAPLYKYKEIQGNQFLDENEEIDGEEIINVDQDKGYTYWVFLQVNEKDWSSGLRLDVQSAKPATTFKLPDLTKFWDNLKWRLGLDPASPDQVTFIQFLQSMQAGTPTPGDPKGGIAFAASGNIMYYADTGNNRVMIYTRDGALDCENFTDIYEKQACLFQYMGAPLTARNILGQNSASNNFACGHVNALPQNECLTAPKKVTVIGQKLLISDSGNNRIVVYDHLPLDGCLTEPAPGFSRPRDCTPNWVIGKAGLLDTTTYDLATVGNATLNSPTDIAVKEGSLYIADTGNNRIIRVANWASRDTFNCTVDTWGSPLCQFAAVLGQPDFYTKDTFEDMVTADPLIIEQTGLKDTLAAGKKELLQRYFRSPVRIKFAEDGKLMIAANERFERPNSIGGKSALHARILIFNENPIDNETAPCNPATFDIGECDADEVIGQARFDKLETVSTTGASAYNQLQHGLYSVDDFDTVIVPPSNDVNPETVLLMTVSSIDNTINVWFDWPTKMADGYPKSGQVTDPVGRVHPTTGQLAPDLKSLCAIRIVEDTSNIYISDCEGHRVFEIQAQDFADI